MIIYLISSAYNGADQGTRSLSFPNEGFTNTLSYLEHALTVEVGEAEDDSDEDDSDADEMDQD